MPSGPRFIVAAITLGHLDEHPFSRQGRRTARIVLADPGGSQDLVDLEVEVDRGVATYVHPLPEGTDQEFVDGTYKGWGQERNSRSSPSYVEVSAVPSATLKVKQGDQEVGSVRWGEVEQKGSVETPQMRFELIDRGKNWVHVTILDDDTGKPVPCRVHFRSPEGVPFQPYGHHNQVFDNIDTWHLDVGGDVRLGHITYAYIDGTCQGWLPRGEAIVDVARGFEYEPLREKVTIAPGQRELTLRLKRWTNMNAQGWFSGDSHVHFPAAQGAHTEGQGEGLNVVNVLQSQWGSLYTGVEDFTGAPSISRDGDCIVFVGQENRQQWLGHLLLWGMKKPVMPWCSGDLNEAELAGTTEITLSDWADKCHAEGGYVINAHFPYPNGEPAVLIATDRLDGIEWCGQIEFNHNEYYRYLNCGYRLPLVGGTDKMTSDRPMGVPRTYARLREDEEFNYENWCKNVSRGRTFLSGGPIIHFTADGHEIGDMIELSGAGTVEVEAWAEGIFPIHTLEIVRAGRVVASTEARNGARRLELREKVKVDGHTWLAARCGAPGYYAERLHPLWSPGFFAHTSPIYVAVAGAWSMFDEATARYMLALIESDLAFIRDGSGQYRTGTVTHHHGEDDHMAYLERPFREAREAVHRRMRGVGLIS